MKISIEDENNLSQELIKGKIDLNFQKIKKKVI